MAETTIILSIAAVILIFINYRKTGGHYEGIKKGY